MRWEEQKQKRRSMQQLHQMEEQKRACTFKPKVRASSVDKRWTRSHSLGSHGKTSVCSTPTSSTSSTFLSSEPLSFQAFQDRMSKPPEARCRSAGRQWIRGAGTANSSHNNLPSDQKAGCDFSFVDSPHESPGPVGNANPVDAEPGIRGSVGNANPVDMEAGSGGSDPAPLVSSAQDSSTLSEKHGSSRTVSLQDSTIQYRIPGGAGNSCPVSCSEGFEAAFQSKSTSGRSRRLHISQKPTRSKALEQNPNIVSTGAGASFPRGSGKVPRNIVEYSCDWDAVLAIARRGGA